MKDGFSESLLSRMDLNLSVKQTLQVRILHKELRLDIMREWRNRQTQGKAN